MVFHTQHKHRAIKPPVPKINNTNIEKVEQFKFLGLTLDSNLNWKKHSDNIYIIREEASIFAPQRLRFYRALGVAACTVGKVRASTVFMCVCSMFRPSDFLLFVKNGFVVGVRCQGNREPPADGATTPLSQRHAWLALPKQ